jgi:hypothetical protein
MYELITKIFKLKFNVASNSECIELMLLDLAYLWRGGKKAAFTGSLGESRGQAIFGKDH